MSERVWMNGGSVVSSRRDTRLRASVGMRGLALVGALLAITAGSGTSVAIAQGSGAGAAVRTISVRGEGEVRIEPDEVVFSIGITAIAEVLQTARADHDRRAAALLASMRAFPVDDRDIQTSRLHIRPRYRRGPDGRQSPDGYEMSQTITVTLRELDRLEPLIGILVESGMDSFSGPHYRSSRQDELEEEATRLALLDALARAGRMAGVLGQRVGEPMQITQEGVAAPAMFMEMQAGRSASAPVTAPGEMVVAIRVSVTFRLLEGQRG